MTASERVRVRNRRHAAVGTRAQRCYGICFTGSAEHFP
jgi:hypothetical protein